MEVALTFGEYMRRLRRDKGMSLHALAEATALSYPHLSRLENDATIPKAETVTRIAVALDGDLKAMLQLAACLPQAILDRMVDQGQGQKPSLKRRANLRRREDDELARLTTTLAEELSSFLPGTELEEVTEAVKNLVKMDEAQRRAAMSVIRILSGDVHGDQA